MLRIGCKFERKKNINPLTDDCMLSLEGTRCALQFSSIKTSERQFWKYQIGTDGHLSINLRNENLNVFLFRC